MVGLRKSQPSVLDKPVAERLSELLGQQVIMCDDVVGEDAYKKSEALDDGDVMLLENVDSTQKRKNDAEFAKKLSAMGELYVI